MRAASGSFGCAARSSASCFAQDDNVGVGRRKRLGEREALYAEVGVEDGAVGGQGSAAVVEEAEADEVVAGYD